MVWRTFLCVLFCFFSQQSLQAETLRVGLSSADYPPYYFEGLEGMEGAAIEIAEDLANQLGYNLEYHRYPWKRVQHNLKTGAVDMVLLYFKTDERAKDVIYTRTSHLIERSSLVIPIHLDIQFDGDLDALKQFEFYGVRGYFYGDQYEHAEYLSKHYVSDEIELVRWIATERRNFIGVGNKPTLEFYANKLGLLDKIKFVEPVVDEGKNYFAFSKMLTDAENIAIRFSNEFDNYKKTGRYKEILNQYKIGP